MSKTKLEDIVWIGKQGESYIHSEMLKEWKALCLENANSKKTVEKMKDLVVIFRMLNDDFTVLDINKCINLSRYKDKSKEWLAIQVARFSPKGESFVKDFVENFNVPFSDEAKEIVSNALENSKKKYSCFKNLR